MTLFPHVFRNLRYDPGRDFVPVTRVASGDFALTIGPMVPAKDMKGFRAWLKTAGDKASYGSPGAGTIPHFVGVAISRQLGVPQEKLDLVATWHEAGIFSDKEAAALAWAETLTRLADKSVPDEAYTAVREHFSESEVVFLSTSIATINAWNRLAISFRAIHPVKAKAAVA